MPSGRRSKRVHKLNKGPNFIDAVIQVDGVLFVLQKKVEEFVENTPREELRDIRSRIMKLCNPDRQGITETQRNRAGEIRDEFHRKLGKFGIPRWWQQGSKATNPR